MGGAQDSQVYPPDSSGEQVDPRGQLSSQLTDRSISQSAPKIHNLLIISIFFFLNGHFFLNSFVYCIPVNPGLQIHV